MALFISLEGPDGSGKSTQAHMLANALREDGFRVVETREPGGTPLGELLRTVILDPAKPESTPVAMALLISASRAQLVEEVIRPALAAGSIVIADRYADSTIAYQGYGLGVDRAALDAVRAVATGGLAPDVTIYVDISPEIGATRMNVRGAHNRLDRLDLDFHRRVRAGYHAMIAEEPERWLTVDGGDEPEEVHRHIMAGLRPRLDAAVPA